MITPNGCASSEDADGVVLSVEKAVRGGVSFVQLRDKETQGSLKMAYAHRLRKVTANGAWLVINADPEIARQCGADGVHFPEHMMGHITGLRGDDCLRLVGCSVHSSEKALQAARLGAHYVQVGTMFSTQSHPGKVPEGVALVREVRQCLDEGGFEDVAIIGVGGINKGNCGTVVGEGADGVAVIQSLCDSSDPEGEARSLIEAM
ncbi:unnamed protein product, partial [Discosporangium mesarthrocarpum]